MTPFLAVICRDLRLAFRAGGSALLAMAFFATVATLIPFGIGSDLVLLGRVAGGVVWLSAMLATLLTLDRMFQPDSEDGTLDIMLLSPFPLEGIAAAKIVANWLTTGLPLTLLSPVLGLLLDLPRPAFRALIVSLAIGTPAVCAIGAIAAALTLSIRRGGLILPLLVLPLIVPDVIFGSGAVLSAAEGIANGALWLLAAFSLVSVLLSPFVVAASLRLSASD